MTYVGMARADRHTINYFHRRRRKQARCNNNLVPPQRVSLVLRYPRRGGRLPPPPDPYAVLGLQKTGNPSSSEIRKAYHGLARLHHPDKARSVAEKETSEVRFKEIGAAYELLSDPEKRADFDSNGFDSYHYQTPEEQDQTEKHARRVYCVSMGIPECVVRTIFCSFEEMFAGCTFREGVVVHVIGLDSQMPEKESKVFTVRVHPGSRDGKEIRFGAMHTNNLQSVVFLVREKQHPFFQRPLDTNNLKDVCARVALTRAQLRKGTILRLPTLSGNVMSLKINPNSAVVTRKQVKTIKGEGFCFGKNFKGELLRGDLFVTFRVMSDQEVWVRLGIKTYVTGYKNKWWMRVGTWCVAGYVGLWGLVTVLEWALGLDENNGYNRREKIPDRLLVGNFPGSYGVFGGSNNDLFYPRFRVPKEIADLWLPTGLGKYAAFVGMAVDGPWRRRKR